MSRPELVGRLRAAGCVYAEEEADLLLAAAATPDQLAALTARRLAGEPLEYVLGWAEFCGLRIAVTAGVFVPRQRSRLLAAQAIALTSPGATVLDLCCGAGALGAAVRAAVSDVRMVASDIDPAAVACARQNLPGVDVVVGDLFAPLPPVLRGQVDVLICNAPYVPTEAIALMPPEAREYEAPAALDGGPDGLDLIRRVAAGATGWLAPGGTVLVEAGADHAPAAAAIFTSAGLDALVLTDDDLDATIVTARRPQ